MKVVWTPEAERDRADILDYIAVDNPQAAVRMDELFSEAVDRLGDFPMLGHVGRVPGTRELIPHESYRLVLRVRGGHRMDSRARPYRSPMAARARLKH